jgi:hypothetical protein
MAGRESKEGAFQMISNEARHRRTRHRDAVQEVGGVQGLGDTWRKEPGKKGFSVNRRPGHVFGEVTGRKKKD